MSKRARKGIALTALFLLWASITGLVTSDRDQAIAMYYSAVIGAAIVMGVQRWIAR